MKKLLVKFLCTFVILVFADLICAGLWAWGAVYSFKQNVPKVPIAVVLMGDFDSKTGELGSETRRRLAHVLDLYDQKIIEYVLCVGGARPRFNVFGSESMQRFLINAGIPKGRVFSEKKSFDTYTNWLMARHITKGHGWKRVVAVSSPFHLYRLRQIVNDEPRTRFKVFFSPYILKQSWPPITVFDIWQQVHYEWAANLSSLLPEEMYKKLIHQMRGQ